MTIEGESSEDLQASLTDKIDQIEGIKELNSHLLVKRWSFDPTN